MSEQSSNENLSQVRKIIHIDMDAFFASIEQRDHPQWRNIPLAVGGRAERRGVIAAASYEARVFGVHSAMPTRQALQRCPHLLIVPHRMAAYREASLQIRQVFSRYTTQIEPLSLDEAYLDVTRCLAHQGSATEIAREIKRLIFEQVQVTASAGVSYNKFLAKLASDVEKPDGLTVIPPDAGEAFVSKLAVGKFHGVGKVTEAKMQGLGIYTGEDLRRWPLSALQAVFGQSATFLYHIARGLDYRAVEPDRERHSIGAETTFKDNLLGSKAQLAALHTLCAEVSETMSRRRVVANTLNIKVRYPDFTTVTRQQKMPEGVLLHGLSDMTPWLETLLSRTEATTLSVRLLGVSVSGLSALDSTEPTQLDLF